MGMSVSEQQKQLWYESMGWEVVNGHRTRACIEREATREAICTGRCFHIYKLEIPGFTFVAFCFVDTTSEHVAEFDGDKNFERVNTIPPDLEEIFCDICCKEIVPDEDNEWELDKGMHFRCGQDQ